MKILSLDESTNVSGYSIFDKGELIKYGEIDISDIDDVTERINTLKHLTDRFIEKYQIDKVIIEDIQLQNGNVKGFKTLSRLQGTLLDYFFEKEIPYVIIPSVTWKSICGIKGRKRAEQKQNAIDFVKEKYRIEVSSDTADAICLGFSQILMGE